MSLGLVHTASVHLCGLGFLGVCNAVWYERRAVRWTNYCAAQLTLPLPSLHSGSHCGACNVVQISRPKCDCCQNPEPLRLIVLDNRYNMCLSCAELFNQLLLAIYGDRNPTINRIRSQFSFRDTTAYTDWLRENARTGRQLEYAHVGAACLREYYMQRTSV